MRELNIENCRLKTEQIILNGQSEDCSEHGKCLQLPGIIGKSCLCQIDWAGEYCDQPRTCFNSFGDFQKPCLNGGECIETSNDGDFIECVCENGFYGKNCENIHPCHHLKKSPCPVGETCVQGIESGFKCDPIHNI